MYSSEKKDFHDNLIKKVADLLVVKKVKQKRCSKLGNCNYIEKQIYATNFTVPEANGYLEFICEHFPDACELNINDKK